MRDKDLSLLEALGKSPPLCLGIAGADPFILLEKYVLLSNQRTGRFFGKH
jgi:hypothetical protein